MILSMQSAGATSPADWPRHALAISKVIAWRWNPATGAVDLASPAAYPASAPREALLHHIHPEDLPALNDALQTAAKTRSVFSIEVRLQRPGPEERWLLLQGGAHPSEDSGPPILYGVAYDVSERKRAERVFLSQEQLYRRVVESVAEAICTLDTDARVTFVNAPAIALTGYVREEILGRPIFEALFPADAALAMQRFERRKTGIAERYETRVRRRDGSAVWVDISSAPMLDDAGRFTGSLLMATDITERKAAEAEMARQRAALERSNADLQQFAYVTSHDLQEPLRTIQTYTQLLTQRYGAAFDDEARQFISFITGSVQRMDNLIRDLLAYSQVVARDPTPPAERASLKDVVEWALMNLRHSIRESGATVRLEDVLPVVQGDPTQLIQLFQNLLSNAIKYRGKEAPAVVIGSSQNDGGEWQISVRDNGIGIAPKYHRQVFGLFKRLHGQELPGTGLGLAICQRIVERHGGRIWVESDVGQGSTFFFTLPA